MLMQSAHAIAYALHYNSQLRIAVLLNYP